ncbi:MAG: DUF4920 domain-containing protein [Acidimicrobiia bacterium]|nr:DUF4920 domain-containing protein [Acidimicrobiia bacterium]
MKLAIFLLAATFAAAEVKLGQPLTLSQPSSVTQVLSQAATHTGKTVQVKGKVTEVCQMMGCWMALIEPGKTTSLRIKVDDGVIVFPKESIGKMAIAEGKLVKLELNKEQAVARAKHEAEEQGRKFDPSSVKGPVTIYQIAGTGAVILD